MLLLPEFVYVRTYGNSINICVIRRDQNRTNGGLWSPAVYSSANHSSLNLVTCGESCFVELLHWQCIPPINLIPVFFLFQLYAERSAWSRQMNSSCSPNIYNVLKTYFSRSSLLLWSDGKWLRAALIMSPLNVCYVYKCALLFVWALFHHRILSSVMSSSIFLSDFYPRARPNDALNFCLSLSHIHFLGSESNRTSHGVYV